MCYCYGEVYLCATGATRGATIRATIDSHGQSWTCILMILLLLVNKCQVNINK